ncbi:hypothetical protein Dred_3220 [Desulforamulus reducens MI-1]|uniref:Uncharacterized protein n=1 Tax=Desulforamulus reducens (strain ATCC BAA-1160 / DSM 100696 / MI-1) TaxID=349161 RepID=A4J9G9_DESRM|nr:hypothetical protein [Desulforamulus reducens]ABO51722.1 hypothetical protein Dred_3220 [Desulforamulus reducens MI-1]
MALIKLLITRAVRLLPFVSIFFMISFSTISCIGLIYIFRGVFNMRIIMAAFAMIMLVVILETPATICGERLLLSHLNENIVWLLTGLPHIFLLLMVGFGYKRFVNRQS